MGGKVLGFQQHHSLREIPGLSPFRRMRSQSLFSTPRFGTQLSSWLLSLHMRDHWKTMAMMAEMSLFNNVQNFFFPEVSIFNSCLRARRPKDRESDTDSTVSPSVWVMGPDAMMLRFLNAELFKPGTLSFTFWLLSSSLPHKGVVSL